MARFRYQHIKSSVEGKAPTAAQLKVAEIGVNDFAGDEKLFIKNSTGDVVDFPRGYSREYIDDNERVVAEALNDLNTRKLDASAYTPTDLSNYYQKSETSGATELSDEFALYVNKTEVDQVIDETTSASTNPVSSKAVYKAATDNELVWTNAFVALSGTVSAHTEDTSMHVTSADKAAWDAKLDASAYTPTDLSNYYTKSETSGATELSTEFAKYYTTAQTSGATELDTAFGDIDDKFGSGFTVSSVTQVIEENEEIVSGALNDLNTRKLDASAYTPTDLTNYYTKSETSGATEISNALNGLNTIITAHTADTSIHVTQALLDRIAYLENKVIYNGHQYVDLGLPSGTKWATMNVGASSETDYGNYYQYGRGAAQYAATSGDSLYSGTEDPLATSADTAAQVWGGSWHMPTRAQMQELTANTTYEWTTINGVNGGKFTATNGNYVFFPAAGNWVNGSQYNIGNVCCYWGSSPNGSDNAYVLRFYNGGEGVYSDNRNYGYSVRPVVG